MPFFLVVISLLSIACATTSSISDAPFSVSFSTVQDAITCPNGIQGSPGGIVLLVHGTGSTGEESWGKGPYVATLPTTGQGFDVCFVDLPSNALVDAQLSAEFVALSVKNLAPQSATDQVSIIGHSQGAGLNPQWALVFFPSIQPQVSQYIALAGDFQGTGEGLLACSKVNVIPCNPSVFQQTIGSDYLSAQNSQAPGGGGQALVATTSIFTVLDDVIQHEIAPLGPTSFLKGADVHALQDTNVCGSTHLADHFSMIFDNAAFQLSVLALTNGSPIDLSKFDKSACSNADNANLKDASIDLKEIVSDVVNVAGGPTQNSEPPLQPYVCERGFAKKCGSAFTPEQVAAAVGNVTSSLQRQATRRNLGLNASSKPASPVSKVSVLLVLIITFSSFV